MSNLNDYLKDLHAVEQQQGIALLRSIVIQFSSTLNRLPNLKHEVDEMLCCSSQGVNYESLATSLEHSLDKAANLLAKLDLLPNEILNAPELGGLLHGLQNTMTLRTIDTWSDEFSKKNRQAEDRLIREKQEAEERTRLEQVEAKRKKVEAERRKAEVIEKERWEKEEAEESARREKIADVERRRQEREKAEQLKAEADVLKRRQDYEAKRVLIIEDNLLIDRATGLIWTVNSYPAGEKLNWSKSLDWLTFFNRRSVDHNWRFPTNNELLDLRTKLLSGELITESKYVIKNIYWSSSPAPMLCRSCVNMDKGEESYLYTFASCYLWPVRTNK